MWSSMNLLVNARWRPTFTHNSLSPGKAGICSALLCRAGLLPHEEGCDLIGTGIQKTQIPCLSFHWFLYSGCGSQFTQMVEICLGSNSITVQDSSSVSVVTSLLYRTPSVSVVTVSPYRTPPSVLVVTASLCRTPPGTKTQIPKV